MIYTIGISISFFLSFILLTKKKVNLSDKILATWLFFIALHLSFYVIALTNHFLKFPFILGLDKPISISHGAFIYLYTLSLTSPYKLNWKNFIHFIPAFLSLLILTPVLILSSEEKILVYQNNGAPYTNLFYILFIATIVFGIFYSILSFRRLQIHKKNLANNFSYTEKINLKWLLYLIIGISFVWLIVIFGNDELIFTAAVAYVLYIGYFGIKQVGIFTNPSLVVDYKEENSIEIDTNSIPVDEKPKYENSMINIEQLKEIHIQLEQLMNTKKVYLTAELTLSMLAEMLDIHPNLLSEVINRIEKKNFFDYINTLRVEEFKSRIHLAKNQNFTLLALAFDCGFNSKTSFNRNFKSITGKSPTEYLKETKNPIVD